MGVPITDPASVITRLPAHARDRFMEMLSRNASTLTHRDDAINAAFSTPKVIVLAFKETGRSVACWLPQGTDIDWGDGVTESDLPAGNHEHLYADWGTYIVQASNGAAVGRASLSVP